MSDDLVLNAKLVFPPKELGNFLGIPKKTKLEPGIPLYRFITTENSNRGQLGNNIFSSPWWFSLSAFREILRVARLNKVSVKDTARARLAITDSFNPAMECFCAIVLTQAAYAWIGQAMGQPKGKSDNVWYIGGAEQIYLPNLADYTGLSSTHAYFQYFGWSQDLI